MSKKLLVKIKKLHKDAVIPFYGTEGAAGMDLTAVEEEFKMEAGHPIIVYKTGLAFEIPKGYVGLIYPRSSISKNTTLLLTNHVGVIDSDYRGEVIFKFRNIYERGGKKYNIGDRIGQIIIVPYPKIEYEEVDSLENTTRGDKGFGSTNK